MNDSEWSERRREYALATQHEGGLYVPRTAGEQVRLTASILAYWRERWAGENTPPTIVRLLRNTCHNLAFWQWQAWRGM
jgi:hypothetical protein